MNRRLTSAGSPHLTAPSLSSQAGQSRNILWPPLIRGPGAWTASLGWRLRGSAGV
jgi:hypothetical protein